MLAQLSQLEIYIFSKFFVEIETLGFALIITFSILSLLLLLLLTLILTLPNCVKVTPEMTAGEIVREVERSRKIPRSDGFALFEVVCGGDLERPLRDKEKVLSLHLPRLLTLVLITYHGIVWLHEKFRV